MLLHVRLFIHSCSHSVTRAVYYYLLVNQKHFKWPDHILSITFNDNAAKTKSLNLLLCNHHVYIIIAGHYSLHMLMIMHWTCMHQKNP